METQTQQINRDELLARIEQRFNKVFTILNEIKYEPNNVTYDNSKSNL